MVGSVFGEGDWRKDRLLQVLAIASAAGIVLVGAAYAYTNATPIPSTPGTAPLVDLQVAYGSPGDANVTVFSVSRTEPLDAFRVNLTELGVGTVFSIQLRVGSLYQSGPTRVTFEDLIDPGRLSAGDRFFLYNLNQGSTYSLVLSFIPAGRTSGSATIIL